jgi:RES domain-containing protein
VTEPDPNLSEPPARRRICSSCVGETFLREEIERAGKIAGCFYCENEGKTVSIEELSNRIDLAFEEHFEITPSEPSDFEYSMTKETDFHWYREGQSSADAIAEAADIGTDAAEDIRVLLADRHYDHHAAKIGEECPFEEGVHYDEKGVDDAAYQEQWADFERRLRQETRFFSRTGFEILTEIFKGVHEHKTRDGRSPVVPSGPGHSVAVLYRARVFQSDAQLKAALERPDLGIGPPPWRSAPAGRMNARGISVFYGAVDVKTAMSEVRPPVGSRVAVAQFEIIRSIKLLDVRVLEEVSVAGSIFDSGWLPRLERAAFLKRLSEKISRPVMPDDEPFDYLITQAIADYLVTEQNLDGIIYPSAQTASPRGNVAIFHRAARVEAIDVPEDTKFNVQLEMYTEDGTEPFYAVSVESPADKPEAPAEKRPFDPLSIDRVPPEFWRPDPDDRPATLRVNRLTVEVHHVGSVEVKTESHSVNRYETQRPIPK